MVPRHDLTDQRRAARQPATTTGPRPAGPPAAPPGQRGQRPAAQAGGFTTREVLAGYLNARAAELLRGLRAYDEAAGSAETAADAAEAVRLVRRAARRVGSALHTFRPLLDTAWADLLSAELRWLAEVLAKEHQYAARLDRLLGALHRLSAPDTGPDGPGGAGAGERPKARTGRPGVGAAKAGALLERQLTLARTRSHSAALRALGSGRFHAVADEIAVLASDAPLEEQAAERPAVLTLRPLAELAHRRLVEAVDTLPRGPEALAHTLTTSEGRYDAAWHHVRQLARQTRYALEVLDGLQQPATRTAPDAAAVGTAPEPVSGGVDTVSPLYGALVLAGQQLTRHRDAAEAASAASAAGRTPRIAPATAYALGVLHADQRHEAEAARLAFCRVWPPKGELQEGAAHARPS